MIAKKMGFLGWVLFGGLVVGLDQTVKSFIKNKGLPFSLNRGGPLGFLAQSGFFGIIASVSLAAVIYWWWRAKEGLTVRSLTGLTLILAGGASNLIDRWRWGGVMDYWPSLFQIEINLADLSISLGAALILADSLWPLRVKK